MKPKIIIKKVRKKGHSGHHGGSWKVAYADFVTAMMAFFLLLWLITMVAPERRARVAAYFKEFTIFEKSGSSMFLNEQGGVTGEAGGAFGKMEKNFGKGITDLSNPEAVGRSIRQQIAERLADVQDQVAVEIADDGIRIQLIDSEGRPLFKLGSSELSPNAVKILLVISDSIRSLDNKIAIEGHTDALSYASGRYTNWELSTERASAARKELEKDGLDPDRLYRVSGYAATAPLIKDNPADPRNRRISIILLFPKDGRKHEEREPAERAAGSSAPSA